MIVRRASRVLVLAMLCAGASGLGCDQGPFLSKTGGPVDPRKAIAQPGPIDPHKLTSTERLSLNQLVSEEADGVETASLEALLRPETKPAMAVAASRELTRRGQGEEAIGALIAHPDTDPQVRVNLIKHLAGRSTPQAVQALEASFDRLARPQQIEMLQILDHLQSPAHESLRVRARAHIQIPTSTK